MAEDLETAIPQMCYITYGVYMPDLDGAVGKGRVGGGICDFPHCPPVVAVPH